MPHFRMREVAAAIPHPPVVGIPGAGHFIPFDAPRPFVRELGHFLDAEGEQASLPVVSSARWVATVKCVLPSRLRVFIDLLVAYLTDIIAGCGGHDRSATGR